MRRWIGSCCVATAVLTGCGTSSATLMEDEPAQSAPSVAATPALVASDDLQALIGAWSGSLTYLDYTSGEPFSMPVELEIAPGSSADEVLLHFSYPNEPNANGSGSLVRSDEGRTLNNEEVVARRSTEEGVEVVTEYDGQDGNDDLPARIRITYSFGPSTYASRKEVRFEGTDEWLVRNTFAFTR